MYNNYNILLIMPRDLRMHNYIRMGIIICIFGNGKIKTSSCIGMIHRSSMYNLVVIAIWLTKFDWTSNERLLGINYIDRNYKLYCTVMKFSGKIWCLICRILNNPFVTLLYLDEITTLFNYINIFSLSLRLRLPNQYIICAGRKSLMANSSIISINYQHHIDIGIGACVGIEY